VIGHDDKTDDTVTKQSPEQETHISRQQRLNINYLVY